MRKCDTQHDHNHVHSGHHPAEDSAGRGGPRQHHVDHRGHEEMFRTRFWVSLFLSIPVLIFSPMVQDWLGFRAPAIPGSEWIPLTFSLVIFAYGGLPFLQMAVPEIQDRRPGMMTLISMAITVALVYSVLADLVGFGEEFFWELVTLIDIMLLGHWIEMRSIGQASGALDELAELMPDTAERITDDGGTETVPVTELNTGDRVIAGTVNGDSSRRVRVAATGEETALAGIMRMVEQAQQSKSRTQVLADRAAGWLFYVAVAVAVLTAAIWSAATGFDSEVLLRVATSWSSPVRTPSVLQSPSS